MRRRQVLLHQVVILSPNQIRSLCRGHLSHPHGQLRDQFQLLLLLIALIIFAHDGAWGYAPRRKMDRIVMIWGPSSHKREVEFPAELRALILAFGVLVPQ